MIVRDHQIKQGFIQFLRDAPDLRFWQAIAAFTGFPFVLVKRDIDDGPQDTFYLEGEDALCPKSE